MDYGWGRVSWAALQNMLKLHEFYFDVTERDPYIARMEGSDLLREISDQINRSIGGGKPLGNCPRGDAGSKFVGLVGHDTNLASINALLGITWDFTHLPKNFGMRDLPANDALPAGALVFELRTRRPDTSYALTM